MSLYLCAREVAQSFVGAGIEATADPRVAVTFPGPGGVFVPPPTRDHLNKLDTWEVVCLAGTRTADLTTLRLLSDLADRVAEVAPVESTRPGLYQLVSDQPPHPVLFCTFTTPEWRQTT